MRTMDDALLLVVDGSLRVRLKGGTTEIAGAEWWGSSTTSRSDTRPRARALAGRAHEDAGPHWDLQWPTRAPIAPG